MTAPIFNDVENLPEQLKEPFSFLRTDVLALKYEYEFYIGLFANEQNTKLFSEVARPVFNIIYHALLDRLIMAICRLSDPEKTMGKTNLSLVILVNYVPELDTPVCDFQNLCKPVREIRKKRIGHRDYESSINPLTDPIPGISFSTMNQIINSAINILKIAYGKFDDPSRLIFEIFTSRPANTLVNILRQSEKYNDIKNLMI